MSQASFINGADYFQLYLHRENKKLSADGNIMRILLVLEADTDLLKLQKSLQNNQLLQQINGLQLKSKALDNYYFWESDQRRKVSVEFSSEDKILSDFEFSSLSGNEWVKIELIESDQKKAVLFHLHHLITDNKGFQKLIESIAFDKKMGFKEPKPLKKCGTATNFFKETAKVLRPKKGKMRLFAEKIKKRSKGHFYIRSESLNKLKHLNTYQSGFFPGKSILLLNAITEAVELWDIHQQNTYYWVPMPVDRRKIGEQDFYLGNQLSFLFFKIQKGQESEARIRNLQTQMIDQVKNKAADRYEKLTNTMTRFFYPLYKAMIELPDRGKFCSFTFSDLGETFSGLDSFLGYPLKDVYHFPSIPMAPGLVFSTMVYQNTFRVVLGADQMILSEREANLLLDMIVEKLKNV